MNQTNSLGTIVRGVLRACGHAGAFLVLMFGYPATRPGLAAAQDGAGVTASKKATAKDVGLPLYPGAKPHKDSDSDTDAFNVGAWGGTFGIKLAVLKLESPDSPDKVAAFYAKALAKYGKVLNCTDPAQAKASKHKTDSSNILTCDESEKSDKGEVVYKAGTKDKQHVVSVKPNGTGSVFALVYVEAHGDDDKKPTV
jgi:hypothetical protein